MPGIWRPFFIVLAAVAIAYAAAPQSPKIRVFRPADQDWSPAAHLPSGARAATIHETSTTGGRQFLMQFPAGYETGDQTHATAESIVVVKGKLLVEAGTLNATLGPGGNAYFPSGTPHRIKAKGLFGPTLFIVTTDAPY